MFQDPACEEEHERKMKTMKMAGDPATVFFQKLEREASWQEGAMIPIAAE